MTISESDRLALIHEIDVVAVELAALHEWLPVNARASTMLLCQSLSNLRHKLKVEIEVTEKEQKHERKKTRS